MTDVDTTARITDPEFASLLMADLLFTRRASERFWNLQRQGRLATVAPLTGQEAAVVGVVRALDLETDWLVPYYRDVTGFGALGDEFMEQLVVYWRGHPDGGRIPEGVRCLPVQISLGTQLPHAAGLAWGLALRGDPGVVCTFLGDGATSEGDFYEAINLAGVQRAPLIVVCINNGWAISTPAARQTAAPTFAAKADAAGIPGVRVDGNDVLAVLDATRIARRRAAAGDGPTLIEAVTYRMGAHTNSDDPTRYVPDDELQDWRRRDPIERFRTELQRSGLWDDERHAATAASVEARLEGIIDRALARELEPAAALDHVTAAGDARSRRATRRDRRSERARRRARRRVRCPRRARRRHRGGVVASMTMLAAIRETIVDEMARDERVVLLGEDVGANGGVFRATDGVLEHFGPRRVFDTPLAEAVIVGASVGLSAAGLVPVAEIQFAGFSLQAYHQIVGQLARMRYRSRGRFHCPVTVRAPYGGGVRTPEFHPDSVEGPYAHTPGLTVVVPSNAGDARGLLTSAIRSEDPVLFFEPIPCYRTTGDVPDGEHVVPLGRAEVVRGGDDAVVIAWGAMVNVASRRRTPPTTHAARVSVWSTCARSGRSTRRRSCAPLNTPGGSSSYTRPRSRLASVPRWSRPCRKRRSTRSRHRSSAVAGYDVGSPPPLVEDWCRPDVARRRRRARRVPRCLSRCSTSSPIWGRA